MRITYVLPRPELSGGNKVAIHHAHLLARRGHEVTVLAEGPPPAWIRVDLPYQDYALEPPFLGEQDVVVATFWPTLALARDLGVGPVVHFCQGYEGDLAHLRPRLAEIEAAYAIPAPALTVSPHLAERLRERFGRPARVVPPSVDPLFRPAIRLRPARPPRVAVPGIFEAEVKGVEVALEAIRRLRARGVPARVLRFATLPLSPAERDRLEPERYLCGARPREVARELRRCDLLLLASREGEGFGLPALEAMAAKVPVVASRIPSTAWFAAEAATLVPPGDPEAFAAAAEELLGDAGRWRRARRAGRRVARRFTGPEIARRLEEALHWARQEALRGP
jgi:glycosyltransferase involved in cell wall biosynthesis